MALESSLGMSLSWPQRHLGKLLVLLVLMAGLLYLAPRSTALMALVEWAPALAVGFSQNILISVAAISIGSVLGLQTGALALSPLWIVRLPARLWVQMFRNAPWLVLIYFTTYVFPFEINLGSTYIAFPDWAKVTIGLALPASANIAEIFRGAITSIPSTQWEAARSLAFTRSQIFLSIILPQCFKRMLPPWMNLYAVVTMGTALASLVGVHDVIDTAQIASSTVNQSSFTVVIYLSLLLLFFAYCYPVSLLTRYLEQRYAFN